MTWMRNYTRNCIECCISIQVEATVDKQDHRTVHCDWDLLNPTDVSLDATAHSLKIFIDRALFK